MTAGRFERLEGERDPSPDAPDKPPELHRFQHLEIGEIVVEGAAPPRHASPPAPPASRPDPPAAPPSEAVAEGRVRCLHCGQINEKERELCWACFRFVAARAAPPSGPPSPQAQNEITLILDGRTYRSGDPGLSADVRALMERVRREGYSPELLAQWQRSRSGPAPVPLPKGGRVREAAAVPAESSHVEVFQGQRVAVIRLDGKVYRSDQADLDPEMRRLFAYVEREGVTPALLEYLRRFGDRVKYRPATTADPSDGEVAFWEQVNRGTRASAHSMPDLEAWTRGREAQTEVEAAQRRYQAVTGRLVPTLVGIGIFVLYLLLRVFVF